MYEEYREKFRITEWRDGCIYGTVSLGCGWFPQEEIHGNLPAVTKIMYVAASDEFAKNNMTIRRAKK